MNEFLRRILFLPPQASTVAPAVDHLHFAVILTTMGGAILITIVGGLFLLRYRAGRRKAHQAVRPPIRAVTPPLAIEAGVVVFLLGLFFLF